MKNFNIFGVHWKIQLLRGGSQKTNTQEGDYLKRGAWTVADLREAWQERGGGAFEGVEGGWDPNAHHEFSVFTSANILPVFDSYLKNVWYV